MFLIYVMIKRIESKEESSKKHKRNQFILAGFLMIILVGSLFGIVVSSFGKSSSENSVSYNGYEFFVNNGYYSFESGDNVFYFSYNPNNISKSTDDVSLTKTLADYAGKTVYVASDDYSSYFEIVQNFDPVVSRIQGACVDVVCADNSLPAKTCDDDVIVIKISDENKIYEKNNCVFIEGREEDLLKLTDEFLLYQIGVNK